MPRFTSFFLAALVALCSTWTAWTGLDLPPVTSLAKRDKPAETLPSPELLDVAGLRFAKLPGPGGRVARRLWIAKGRVIGRLCQSIQLDIGVRPTPSEHWIDSWLRIEGTCWISQTSIDVESAIEMSLRGPNGRPSVGEFWAARSGADYFRMATAAEILYAFDKKLLEIKHPLGPIQMVSVLDSPRIALLPLDPDLDGKELRDKLAPVFDQASPVAWLLLVREH